MQCRHNPSHKLAVKKGQERKMRIEPLWVPLDMVTNPLITTNEIRYCFVKTNDVVVSPESMQNL